MAAPQKTSPFDPIADQIRWYVNTDDPDVDLAVMPFIYRNPTPMQTFLDAMPIAKEKMIAA
jgi:hypothetical protein